MNKIKKWWGNTSYGMKFTYGMLIGLIIVSGIIILHEEQKKEQGLRIDKNYIKSISGQEAYVNDVYVTTMVNFVDKCNSTTTLHRFNDLQKRLHGITLWCRGNINSFTFFYSDKWRKEQYGAK